MPRRKTLKIALSSLACADVILDELSKRPGLENFETEGGVIHLRERKPAPYIRDMERATDNLRRFHAANRERLKAEEVNGKQTVTRGDLARMMRVSRPTLKNWIDRGFIRPSAIPYLHTEYFQIEEVIEQLRKQKKQFAPSGQSSLV
jgi:hypothetical protein